MAGTSYTRQSTLTDGDTITASLFNDEYNQLVNAFAYAAAGTTGHQHDGGAGEGGNIEIIGDQDFKNKIIVDSTNNRWSVFVEVGGTAVEQVRIEDGVVYPVTDSDVDLGTDALRFKNAYIDSLTATGALTIGGTIEFAGLSGTGAVTVTNILDEDNMASDSATALVTQQSVKAYVDSQVTAQDLDLTDGTTSISIDLDSEALSVLGGTGVTSTASGNGVTLAIDSTVATLTGSQTLTNKTLTSPDIDGGTIDNAIIGGTTAAAGSFTTITASGEITANGGIALGDGDLATFGASDDLQIYHDGSVNRLDSVSSSLAIKAPQFIVQDAGGTKNMIWVPQGGSGYEVQLSHDGTTKLTTTATGIDVTGTVVADGLTVDGATTFNVGNTTGDGVVISGTDSGGSTAPDLVLYRDSSSPADGDNVGMLQFRGNTSTSASANYAAIFAAIDDVTDGTMDGSLSFSVTSSGNQAPSSGTVIMTLDSTGIDVTGNVSLPDNGKATFGSGDDLQIYHDGSNSYIQDQGLSGTGNLILAGADVEITTFGGSKYFQGSSNVARLYHTNNEKLATTATGIAVTGNASFADGGKATFGVSDDLQIFHNGSNSLIQESGTGNLNIQATNLMLEAFDGTNYAYFEDGGAATFYHSGDEKLATTSTGIDVTGTVVADKLAVTYGVAGSAAATITHSDVAEGYGLKIQAGGTGTSRYVLKANDGGNNSRFEVLATGDVSFYEDTGTTAKMVWDASAESLGIGTAPDAATVLHVQATEPQVLISDASNPLQRFMAFDVGLAADEDTHFITVDQADALAFGEKLNGNDRVIENEWMRITNAGLVGIGTDNPSQALHVKSTTSNPTGIGLQNSLRYYAVRSNNYSLVFSDETVSQERMRIDNSGNLGIGTSSPTSALTVGSGAVNGTAITLNSPFATNNYADLIFSSGGTTAYNARIRATVPGDGTRKLEFITAKDAAENTVLTLDGDKNALFSGSVGIGPSSPDTLLHLSGDATAILRLENTASSLVLNSVIGGIEFEKQDASGAGAGVAGSVTMISDNSTGAETALTFGTSSTARGNNAEAMRIDALGNVGIGTDSPASVLDVSGEAPTLTLRDSRTGGSWTAGTALGKLDFYTSDSTGIDAHSIASVGVVAGGANTASPDGELVFATGGYNAASQERMRISSDGSVGIGTDSPARTLEVNAGSTQVATVIGNTNGTRVRLTFKDANTTNDSQVGVGAEGNELIAHAGGAERMRIDNNGNLFVGKSNVTESTEGAELRADGWLKAIRSGDYASTLRRNDSDGGILEFNKDGTTVGSIGSEGGDALYIQSGTTSGSGLHFHPTNEHVLPAQNGDTADDTIDLGRASKRFKDLYLSGGVVFGDAGGSGSSSSNTLDSYEEGTWTPTLGGGATATGMTGTYTKVGRLVTAYLHLENSTISGTPDYIVSGLPFTSNNNRTPLSVTYYRTFNTACESLGGFVAGNTATMQFLGMVQGGNWAPSALTAGSTRYLFATAVYQAA